VGVCHRLQPKGAAMQQNAVTGSKAGFVRNAQRENCVDFQILPLATSKDLEVVTPLFECTAPRMGAGGRKVAPCRPTRCRSACRSSLANRRLNGRLSRCDEDHRFVSIVHRGRAKRRIASRRAVLGAARGRSPSMTLAPRRPRVAHSRSRHAISRSSAGKPSVGRLDVPKRRFRQRDRAFALNRLLNQRIPR
jgi:hypothetical protein